MPVMVFKEIIFETVNKQPTHCVSYFYKLTELSLQIHFEIHQLVSGQSDFGPGT